MKTYQQILTEGVLEDILKAKPEGRPIANALFNFGRKPDSLKVFTLRKDGWFRSEMHDWGMMFRTVKLLKGQEAMPVHNTYAISFMYYPVEYTGFGEYREDMKANWKRDKGWLWLARAPEMPSIQKVIAWMNKQQAKWIP